jgi:hypothetical protein
MVEFLVVVVIIELVVVVRVDERFWLVVVVIGF